MGDGKQSRGVLIGSAAGLVVVALAIIAFGGSLFIAIGLVVLAALIPLFFGSGSR